MHPTPLRAVRVGALLCLFVGLAGAGNWDRFRGPNGTGDGGNFSFPETLTRDAILWKVEVPGVGHSSPVVWGDKLFLQTSALDGSSRDLVCFNALTGEKLWSQGIKASKSAPGRTHKYSSLASSTPAVDAQRVYTIFWDGKGLQMAAYSHDGKPAWKKDLGKFVGEHGFGGSPVLIEGKLVFYNDQGDQKTAGPADLLAFDPATGEQLWKASRQGFRSCSSSPILHERPDGKKEIVVGNTGGLAGYEIDSGKEIWHYDWAAAGNTMRTVGSPIAAGGLLFIGSGEGKGNRNFVAVKAGGVGDVTKTGLAWKTRENFPYVPTVLATRDHLFYAADGGQVGCVEARTGKTVWHQRLAAGFWSSPVLIGERLYAVDTTGDLYVFKAATEFVPLGKLELGEGASATPAVANDRLYVRTDKHLFCLGKR